MKKRAIRFQRRALYRAINARRKKLGLSWREVARQVGVHDMALHRIKDGAGPPMETYAKIVVWLGARPGTFFKPAQRRA